MSAAVLLIDPKYGHNLGAVVRAAAEFGVPQVRWTGWRGARDAEARLPREERLREYRRRVDFGAANDPDRPVELFTAQGFVPVCVEVLDSAENLIEFEHPERALYVFGPEDGEVPKGVRTVCHRFVRIPVVRCLNLGAAVNVVLYDRMAKANGD
jgi:tRNA(Leu) C34 or U34 (ribose-2'-O)-methylase TrmL